VRTERLLFWSRQFAEHAYDSFFAFTFVGYHAVVFGKDGVVPSQSDATAGVYARAQLSYDDVSGLDWLSCEYLYSPSLPLAVSAVSG